MQSRTTGPLLTLAVAVAVLAMALPAVGGTKKGQVVAKGHLEEFAAGVARGYDISGPVRLTRGQDWTSVKANAKGLAADTTYAAHLHDTACDVADGGPHYMDSATGPATPPNELWLSITTNPSGNGHDASTAPWAVRDGARSVVIHDTDGARIACADLVVG